MKRSALIAVVILLLTGLHAWPAAGQQGATISGRITGSEGRPQEGAMVFVYAGADVRRPPRYTAGPTGTDGRYRVSVPPGRYLAVARLKRTGGMGPLMPGDRHSGDPREVEAGPGREVTVDFVVADLAEAMRAKRLEREGPVRISGRILDDGGSPVAGAYAVANRPGRTAGIPDYLSAWTDGEGRFMLVVPRGRYSVGTATAFPPGGDLVIFGDVAADRDLAGLDIARRPGKQGGAP